MLRTFPEDRRRIILNLPRIGVIEAVTDSRAAPNKCRADTKRRYRVVANLIALAMFVRKPGFVNRRRIDDHRFGETKFMILLGRVVGTRRKCQAPIQALIFKGRIVETVA